MTKKLFRLMSVIALALMSQACSNNDDVISSNELEKNFISIENSTFKDGQMPDPTTSVNFDNIEMSSKVMNGAMNYITVLSQHQISKFFIAVKNIPGYLEFNTKDINSRTSSDYFSYIIPMMISDSYSGDATIIIGSQLTNGNITTPVEKTISYIATMPGAIEVKLAFSNSKDIDLHLFTPGGEHIYYENRGGEFTDDSGKTISYGLDIDSNAGCYLDHINKENIYIPEELVENGTYTVVVDMYSNCDPSIPTDWSIIARYHGELITPSFGNNPASGRYLIDAPEGDMTKVMTFTINNRRGSRAESPEGIRESWKFTPAPISERDLLKIRMSKN